MLRAFLQSWKAGAVRDPATVLMQFWERESSVFPGILRTMVVYNAFLNVMFKGLFQEFF